MSRTRPVLSGDVIDANAATYVAQIGKILRIDPAHLEGPRSTGNCHNPCGAVNGFQRPGVSSRRCVRMVRIKLDADMREEETVHGNISHGWSLPKTARGTGRRRR